MADLEPDQRAQRLARYYDLDTIDVTYDAELYQHLAREAQGPVFELAVGSGRLAIPLALAGHVVVGIDADPAMLQRARTRWQEVRGDIEADRLTVESGDIATYRSEPRFALSFIAVNTFLLAADDAARRAILATMRDHLRPRGTAAVEVGTPGESELARYDGRLQHEWLRHDPETGDEVSKSISALHDADAQTVRLTQVYEWTSGAGGTLSRVTRVDTLHLLPAEHLARLAAEVGFGQVDLRGDHLLTPHGAGSHRVILVARLV